jgi:hypothetical protein
MTTMTPERTLTLMTTADAPPLGPTPEGCTPAELAPAIARACDRIAPSWPLDRLIAVNPYWGFVGAPIEQAAAELTALQGTTLLMPRAWYRSQWEAGRFAERHLARAIADAGSPRRDRRRAGRPRRGRAPTAPWRLMTDAADVGRDLGHAMSWAST